jgi:hypothetical protein
MGIAWRGVLASLAKPLFLARLIGCLLAVSWLTVARAEGSPKTVVMVVDPTPIPLALRLRQEIESLGFVVKWVPSDPAQLPSLEQEAKAASAVASIRIAPMGGSDVDMTIFDQITGKTVRWKLVAATADLGSSELIATRSVELLRASLMEMAARQSRTPAPSPERRDPSPPRVSDPPRERPEHLSLLVGPGASYSRDFRPGIHVLSRLTWMPFFSAGLSASVLAPLVPARLAAGEGTVELFASVYSLGAVLEVTRRRAPVSVRVTAGGGVGRLLFRGVAGPGYSSAWDHAVVALPSLGVTARFPLSSHVRLFADVTSAAAFPRTVIRLAGREAAEWGRPVLSFALGLELSAGADAP